MQVAAPSPGAEALKHSKFFGGEDGKEAVEQPGVLRCASRDDLKLEVIREISRAAYYQGNSEVSVGGGLNRSKRHVERERLTPDAHGMVLALVGLPARGKSFISRKIERFLQWRGLPTRVFNVGKYRREAVRPEESGRSDFFDAGNKAAMAARETAAVAALDDAFGFLNSGGKIAILDATNSTAARRKLIVNQVRAYGKPFEVVFLEAICEDAEVLEANMLGKVQNSPDFWQLSPADALADLKARIAKYEEVYETVQDHEGAYIKAFDLSSKIMANNCYGRLAKSMLPFMMAIHIGARPIWLIRAGSGEANPQSPKGDRCSKLSHAGKGYALSLTDFVRTRAERYWKKAGKSKEPTMVLTSTMPRAEASVCYLTSSHEQTSALNPIDKGALGVGWWDVECHGNAPPWDEMESRHAEFFSEWKKDPFRTRFPGGESYMDVMKRLETLLVEVEMSTRPVLIVSHITVLQLLIAYFRGSPVEEAWTLSMPKNTVMEISPTSGGGFVYEEHPLIARTSDEEHLRSSDGDSDDRDSVAGESQGGDWSPVKRREPPLDEQAEAGAKLGGKTKRMRSE